MIIQFRRSLESGALGNRLSRHGLATALPGPNIMGFYFQNELWQLNKHSLKLRNFKFHKILIKTFQVLKGFVQECANISRI